MLFDIYSHTSLLYSYLRGYRFKQLIELNFEAQVMIISGRHVAILVAKAWWVVSRLICLYSENKRKFIS